MARLQLLKRDCLNPAEERYNKNMAKSKKVYRGADRQELLQQIRDDWGNVQVVQKPHKTLSGKDLFELRVVSETGVAEESTPAVEEIAQQEAPQPVAAAPSGFEEMLAAAQQDADLDQPEQEALRATWRHTERELDSLSANSNERLAIQHQIVAASEQAQARIGQVESHADEIMRVARSQAEEVLGAAHAEAERLQAETRASLESAMTTVLKETGDSRTRAAQLSKLAAEDAQATISHAAVEAARLKDMANEELQSARQQADDLISEISQKTRAQISEVSKESAAMIEDAKHQHQQLISTAKEEAGRLTDQAEALLEESKHLKLQGEEAIRDKAEQQDIVHQARQDELEAEYRKRLEDLENQRAAILGQAGVQSREIIRSTEKAAAQAAERSKAMTRDFEELGDSLRRNAGVLVSDITSTHGQLQDELSRYQQGLPDLPVEKLELPEWLPED